MFYFALPVHGGANSGPIVGGQIEFLSKERAYFLMGNIFIEVYQDQQSTMLIGAGKVSKSETHTGPYSFKLDSGAVLVKGMKWEKPFFIRAVFKGEDNYNGGLFKKRVKKESLLLGPLQGGEKNLKLYID